MKRAERSTKLFSVPVFVVITAAITTLIFPWFAYLLFIGPYISSKSSEWSAFGAYYGGLVGPILSFFAFLILMVNLNRQDYQIKEQDKRIAKIDELQRVVRLEETVGGLLDALNTIVQGIYIARKNKSYRGQRAFFYLYKFALRRAYVEICHTHVSQPSFESLINPLTRDAYINFYKSHGSYVGHYFRTLYTIVKTIDTEAQTDVERTKLISWLTCRLSRFELLLLFYNGLSIFGERRFKPLIERYSLFEHMDTDYLFDWRHLEFYAKSAYGA